MPKCSFCSKEAEFYVEDEEKTIYFCQDHVRDTPKSGKYVFIPRIKKER